VGLHPNLVSSFVIGGAASLYPAWIWAHRLLTERVLMVLRR
jgi:hypothetical protein